MAFDIDEWFKRLFKKDPPFPIEPASPSQAMAAEDMSGLSEEKLVELSRDYNGRVREAAVRDLAQFRTDAAFRAIVERLNDWVSQVRKAAQASLEPFLRPESAELLLRNLHSIMALRVRGRADHSFVLQRAAGILCSAEVRSVLVTMLPLCDGKAARYLLEVLSADGEVPDEECIRAFARHADCVVRLKIVALCRAQPERYQVILEELGRDSHPRVRREAFCCLWQLSNGIKRDAMLKSALLDIAGSVRETAIWYARKSGFDLESFATQALTLGEAGNRATIALLGLLTGLKIKMGSDLAHVAMKSDCAAVRAAALSFLVAMERDAADELVASALADTSNKVARFARQSILRGQIALTHDQYLRAVKKLLSSGCMERALIVCALMAIWGRLEGLFICLGESRSDEDRQLVRQALLNWERQQGCSAIRIDANERGRLTLLLNDRRIRDIVSSERPLVFALQTNGLWADG